MHEAGVSGEGMLSQRGSLAWSTTISSCYVHDCFKKVSILVDSWPYLPLSEEYYQLKLTQCQSKTS